MSTIGLNVPYLEKQSFEQQIRQRSSKSFERQMIPLFLSRKASKFRLNSLQTLLFSLILITFVLILYCSLSLSPFLRLLDPYSYVLVLDAGSTGTRLHVYKFRSTTDEKKEKMFILKSEIFEERKPGLSSFADEVFKAEQQINELLQIADEQVSRFKHRDTPLVLRATAGLRLLSETKQKLLLESVSKTFAKYGFYRPKSDIGIMNETEEGIDAWLTLVYLKGEQFYGSRIAALDLGGGSTQITFNPSLANTSLARKLNLLLKVQQPIEPVQVNAFKDPQKMNDKQMPKIDVNQADLEEIQPIQIAKSNKMLNSNLNIKLTEEETILSSMHQFRMFRRDIKLYSKSYLGYGLMIARQTIFINETNDQQLIKSQQLKSQCFITNVKGKFKFQDLIWTVQSHEDVSDEERFYRCLSLIDNYISLNIQPAIGLDEMSIYVFSYFYDIANDAGLLTDPTDPSITTITIRVLKQTAKHICHGSTNASEHPFLCFDITFIYSLLTKGYGLSEDIQIHICKKIQQFEVAWSLGLALKLL